MQPQSPKPDFDFMLKDNQPVKRGLSLPGIPKPIKIVLAAIVFITILIVALSWFSGRNSSITQPVVNVIARGSETLRVTTLVQSQLQLRDPQTRALAATVSSSLSSDQVQLKTYLTKNLKTKVSAAILSGLTDKSTDAGLKSASQNNRLDSAYVTYLKTALEKYKQNLQLAYDSAGPNGKKILKEAFDSTQTLLSSPPLKS